MEPENDPTNGLLNGAKKIRSLKKELYSRKTSSVTPRERRELHERDFDVSEEWTPEDVGQKTKKRTSFFKILFISSGVFFVISVAISAFLVIRVPAVSPQNVKIDILGPAAIGGGEQLGLQLTITNENPVAIHNVDLSVEYPDGTRSASNINAKLPRHREALGPLAKGEEARRTVRSVLFGEEGSVKDIKVIVEFQVDNSNAIFFAEKNYQLSLATSPLSLTVDTLKEAISGQDIELVATIRSNSKDTINDVLFQIEYPFGFEFKDATPKPSFASRLWRLGDMPPEKETVIKVRGTLSGQDGEERVFRFSSGIESENEPNVLNSAFINIAESIFVQRPFITLDLALNGETEESFSVGAGKSIRGDISWKNNLPTQVFDMEIDVILSGEVLDKRSISTSEGFYESVNDRIFWSQETDRDLSLVAAGEKGDVGFSFSSFGFSSGIPFRNPEIELDVNVRATRLSDDQVPEEIFSTLSRTVKVSSDLILTPKVLHFTGPLSNSGPIPPQVEQETTYTVVWSVTNSSNRLEDVKVVASLPPFVRWTGVTSNPTEDISYNPVGGQVLWRVGNIEPGTGIALPMREIAFQVSLLPSISQIDTLPEIIGQQTITGTDLFSGQTLSDSNNALDTVASDPGFGVTQSVVEP